MKINKSFLKVVAFTAVLVSIAAQAFPQYYEEITYYSDATYTQAVGERSITCGGIDHTSGEVTPYKKYIARGLCTY